jgi:hypothetical protein
MKRETFFKCFDMLKKLGSDYGYITFAAPYIIDSFPYHIFSEYENKKGFLDREINRIYNALNKIFDKGSIIHQIKIIVNGKVVKEITIPVNKNNIDVTLLNTLNELVITKLINGI